MMTSICQVKIQFFNRFTRICIVMYQKINNSGIFNINYSKYIYIDEF